MRPLCVDDFEAYYQELHGAGAAPFPWQSRLVRQVAAEGKWPRLLDLPTGTGKTTALDIAVFAQALDAQKAPQERRAPRRTVLVVDRRTVVDQAHLRALRIANRLGGALGSAVASARVGARAGQRAPAGTGDPLPVLAAVAERLVALAGEGPGTGTEGEPDAPPLGVHLLRGGMPRDNDWARSPTRPLIAVSTVDQVGSRLLFRGYGLSPRMQPVHAGLLANDVLFLLDEVHLAQPFRDLLLALEERYRGLARVGLPDRWQLVQMSATAATKPEPVFALSQDDSEHPLLARRLFATKPTALRVVGVNGGEEKRKRALAKAIAAEATPRLAQGGAIGIVVNRVQTARFVFEELETPVRAAGGVLRLVTGRMRPLDREGLEEQLREEVGADRDRSQAGLRVVVATQCIEAGADFDFDVLLTECASLDALRQRFGRLDRLGLVAGRTDGIADDATDGTADDATAAPTQRGVVFARDDQVGDKATGDPIYGSALAATWEFLSGLPEVDFGPSQLPLPEPDTLRRLLAPAHQAPLLLPAHLDAWVQTSPTPYADPEPALWLHGSEQREAEVMLVWRADLTEELLRAARGDRQSQHQAGAAGDAAEGAHGDDSRGLWSRLQARLEACPPRTVEALPVPLAACRRWLRQEAVLDVSDAGALPTEEDERGSGKRNKGRLAVVWRRDERLVLPASRLAPGDVVIVPSAYGGLRDGSWDPAADAQPVPDLGDYAQLRQTGRVQLRLDARVLQALFKAPATPLPTLPNLSESSDPDFDPIVAARQLLDALPSERLETWARTLRSALLEARPRELRLVPLMDEDEGQVGTAGPAGPARSYFMVTLRRPLTRAALRALLTNPALTHDQPTNAHPARRDASGDAATEPLFFEPTSDAEQASLTGVEVSLREHLQGVGAVARRHGAACGLPEPLCRALELAGRWHDLGKADARFQRWLHHGSAFRSSVAKEPLAKSSLPAQDRVVRERARERSGYPKGARHELTSLALMASSAELAREAGEHWELVQYLVGSHHGWCRPFPPFIADPEPVEVMAHYEAHLEQKVNTAPPLELRASSAHGLERLDAGVPERFWLLVRRYGWFGLAWLEALFRLADHRRSEAEMTVALAPREERDNAA